MLEVTTLFLHKRSLIFYGCPTWLPRGFPEGQIWPRLSGAPYMALPLNKKQTQIRAGLQACSFSPIRTALAKPSGPSGFLLCSKVTGELSGAEGRVPRAFAPLGVPRAFQAWLHAPKSKVKNVKNDKCQISKMSKRTRKHIIF